MRKTALICLFLLLFGCSKGKNEAGMAEEYMEKESAAQMDAEGMAPSPEPASTMDADDAALDTRTVLPAMEIEGRLLEYQISLDYKSKDILKSRIEIFRIISQYGFLLNSSSDISEEYPYVRISFKTRTDSLYKMLTDLNRIGMLKRENVSVTDMTGDEIYRQLQDKREKKRILRREQALRDYNLSKENYEQREQMLEQSENRMDDVEYQLWSLKDRAEWSIVTLTIEGPGGPLKISVPSFYNALITMVNGVLLFVYGLIRFSPLVIVIILIVLKRESITRLLSKPQKRKTNKENEQ